MSDLITLEIGASPWTPTDDATTVEVINHYDAPLTGVLEQHGMRYLYHCLFGHLSALSVWMYVPLDDFDLQRLESVDGDGLDNWFSAVADGRLLTVALADVRGLRHKLEMKGTADLLDLAIDAMEQFRQEVRREADVLSSITPA